MEGYVKQVKPPPPYKPIKYFVSSLNTFFGKELVSQLRNDGYHPDNPNRIVGTLAPGSKEKVPQGVRKVIDTTKISFSQDIILDSDVIIYHLPTCDLKYAYFAITTLKVTKSNYPKLLICVSNVMTWALTPPKYKKYEYGEDVDDGAGEYPDTEEEGKADDGYNKKTYVRFTDKDYTMRRPSPKYEYIKSLETLCLAAGKSRESLKSYVLCSGILYGNGYTLFKPYFEQARLQKPSYLTYYGDGKNRIPTIHVKDLVAFIKKTVERPPTIQYLFAVDQNPKPTFKKIVYAISTGVGTGKVKKGEIDNSVPNMDMLTLNLRIKPSNYFQKLEEEEAAIEVEYGSEVKKFKFEWECREGIQKNIKKLCEYFKKAQNYEQTKIFISGPPACGKSYYAKILSYKYYLPHISVKDVVAQVMALQNNPLAEYVNTFMTGEKERLIEEGKTAFEYKKEKWKKVPKNERYPLEPFDENKVQAILNDYLLYKCFEWRLSQNDCLNRGYVLDGYPRTYDNAKNIFMMVQPPAEGQEENTENAAKIINPTAVPNKVFVLTASDQEILDNLKKLPYYNIQGHLNEADTKRRLKVYRKRNEPNTGIETLYDFFHENSIDVHHLPLSPQLLDTLYSYVKPIEPEEQEYAKKISGMLQKNQSDESKKREREDKKYKIKRDIQLEDYKIKKENEQNEYKYILYKKSLALRKYLDSNVVPFLVYGIKKILKDLPANPVDHLAYHLFKVSLNVPNPDPSTFDQ